MQTPPRYVLTGGPCSGKTTLINELKNRGYSVLPESARTIIAAHLAEGKTIEQIIFADTRAFEHEVIAHQLELESQAPSDEVVFIDRGIPDNVAYYRKFGLALDAQLKRGTDSPRYRKIFLLDMIEFASDAERYETPEEAAKLHEGIRAAYRELGYEIVVVPVVPVAQRADFILQRLA